MGHFIHKAVWTVVLTSQQTCSAEWGCHLLGIIPKCSKNYDDDQFLYVKWKPHSCDSVLTLVLSQCNSTYVSESTSDFISMSVRSKEGRISWADWKEFILRPKKNEGSGGENFYNVFCFIMDWRQQSWLSVELLGCPEK